MRIDPLIVILTAIALGLSLFTISCANVASISEDGISLVDGDYVVNVGTKDMDIAINKVFPAVAIRPAHSNDEVAYGMTISSVIGYNATANGGLVLEDAHYHASFEHSTWAVDTPVRTGDAASGESVTVSMHSSVNINKRLIFGDGNPDPGSPGIEIIENWALVTVEFTITTMNHSTHYDVDDAPDYLVNGSSELKFDVRIEINEVIDADHITLDLGLMKMDFGTFEPTAMPEAYLFQGYQSDSVSVSDPLVNETDGDVMLLHTFQPRSQFKQLFTFTEDDESNSFFGWASQAQLTIDPDDSELDDVTTYYRTDGTALRVYIATPITEDMTAVLHDPSIGLLDGGGYVDLPDTNIIGSSTMSMTIGILIGLAAAGGAAAFIMVRRASSDDRPEDLVSLEKNRYFKGK